MLLHALTLPVFLGLAGSSPSFDLGPEPHIGEYPAGQDIRRLESLPGAEQVIYLDITEIVDDDGEPLTLADKAEMWQAWQVVASSLSMFEVNVTTDAEVFARTPTEQAGRACFLNQDGRSHSGISIFGTTRCATVYKGRYQGVGLGLDAAHQLGHVLGLKDDNSMHGGDFFPCNDGAHWCPLMKANFWPNPEWQDPLIQWSKGEYMGAGNQEDDLDLIARFLPARDDEYTETQVLVVDGQRIDPLKNRGAIQIDDEGDEFSFTLAEPGGQVRIKVERTEIAEGGMLDVDAQLLDGSGNEVARDNPVRERDATIDVTLQAGNYRLIIRGGAELEPSDGFSNYASLGYYAISGTIAGGEDPDTTPPKLSFTAPENNTNIEVDAWPSTVVVKANATDDGSGIASVALALDGQPLATKTPAMGLEWAIEFSQAGHHEIIGEAVDHANNRAEAQLHFELRLRNSDSAGTTGGGEEDADEGGNAEGDVGSAGGDGSQGTGELEGSSESQGTDPQLTDSGAESPGDGGAANGTEGEALIASSAGCSSIGTARSLELATWWLALMGV